MNPIVGAIIGPIFSLITKAFGIDTTSDDTKVKLAQLEIDAQKIVADQLTAQANIDNTEAASTDPFTSRWRPFIGWVCGTAFAYHFLLQPSLVFLLAVGGKSVVLPAFDMNTLFTVLMGMLGLGGLHTFEKVKGL